MVNDTKPDHACKDTVAKLNAALVKFPFGPGPSPKLYACLDNHCQSSNMTTAGVPLAACRAACGTEALKYKCTGSIYKKCVPDDNGTAYESCEQACL